MVESEGGAARNSSVAMNVKQLFAPVPLRAMAMDLAGLDLRVLICVAAHDRLSLANGKGQGCRASNERMANMVGCNYSRLCSTLTKLADLGLLERGKLGRHTTYQVVYTDDDRLLFSNVSGRSIGCQGASGDLAIGCRNFPESREIPPETAEQYIPLNGVIHSVETAEYSSSEEARFAARVLPRVVSSANVGGQMARLERALSVGEAVDRLAWYQYLEAQIDHENPSNSGRAMRLAEQLVEQMDSAECQQWREQPGWAESDGVWLAPHPREAR